MIITWTCKEDEKNGIEESDSIINDEFVDDGRDHKGG